MANFHALLMSYLVKSINLLTDTFFELVMVKLVKNFKLGLAARRFTRTLKNLDRPTDRQTDRRQTDRHDHRNT
ncbi:hypothetical protein BpHYR1_047709 [Brachionus plicatilis]|uniref:Uncharacterized protein n=1 Tax=Brachionus plicatilis TaxID=10195 RepID=A0A3M7QQX1_BRAPC|nr:hypothetical protein BpHYR1_047709 [Brachionus plicatilis]